MHLLRASRAWAALDGRDYVIPDDVQRLARPVLAHRLLLSADAMLREESVDEVVERIIGRVKVPMGVKTANGRSKTAEIAATKIVPLLLLAL